MLLGAIDPNGEGGQIERDVSAHSSRYVSFIKVLSSVCLPEIFLDFLRMSSKAKKINGRDFKKMILRFVYSSTLTDKTSAQT